MRTFRYLDVLCMTMLMLVGCVQNVPINPLKWSPCDSTSDTARNPTSCETVCERITQSCFGSTSLCGNREGNLTDAQALTVQACVLGCQSQIQQANPAAFSDFCDETPAENTLADGVLCEELINTISQKCDEAERNLAASPSPTTVAPDMGGPSGGSSGVGDGGATDSMSGGASGGSDVDAGASGALSDAGASEMGDASQADGGGTGGMSGGGCGLNDSARQIFCTRINNCLDGDESTDCSISNLQQINSPSAGCSSGANCPAADTYVRCCNDSVRWQTDDIFVARARIIVERAKQVTDPQAQQCKDMNKLFSDCITSELEASEIDAVGGNPDAIAVGCAKVLQNDYTENMGTLARLFVDGVSDITTARENCRQAFSANGNGGIASFNVAGWQQHCLKNCVGICGGEGFQDCPVGEACNQSESEATLNLCVSCDDDAVSCACETRTEGMPDSPLMSCSDLYLNLYDCAACGPNDSVCRGAHNCDALPSIGLYEWVHPDFRGGLEACFSNADIDPDADAVFNPRAGVGDVLADECKNFWFSCVYCEAPYNENLRDNVATSSGLSFAHMFCDAYDGAQGTYYQTDFNDAAACDTRRCNHDEDWTAICDAYEASSNHGGSPSVGNETSSCPCSTPNTCEYLQCLYGVVAASTPSDGDCGAEIADLGCSALQVNGDCDGAISEMCTIAFDQLQTCDACSLGGTAGGGGSPGTGGHSGDCPCDDPNLQEVCDHLICLHEDQSSSGLCGNDWQGLTCEDLSEGQSCGITEAICLDYSDRFSTCTACANVNSSGAGGD